MAEQNRNNFADFRRVIEERMTGYAKEVELLEAKLEKEKARVALEITEKPVPSPTPSNAPIQHVNQFVEIVQPRASLWPSASAPAPSPAPASPPARVTVVKESPVVSPVKTKVALPPVEEPEAEAEEEEEEVDADAEDAEADAEAEEEAEEEAEAEEEEEEEEVERDWVSWRHRKNTYWHDQISHEVYTMTPDNGVGDLVGKYVLVNGIASLAPS
jgi:hypothetical protein